ncbi:hypothetical protein V1227_02325 [Lentzea sp. DG1S-22]|nr:MULTISPECIES: hypothetical protein [unclassified Lentzea]MCG8926342.1 hypothetical protein [Lentzea sp. CC55]WVH81614.1 hypothetical protein V1227_02325 [Lentzea sp. DG1S-22]
MSTPSEATGQHAGETAAHENRGAFHRAVTRPHAHRGEPVPEKVVS